MKSYVAVQKKLLILLYTLWKKNEAYNELVLENENPNNTLLNGRDTLRKKEFPTTGGEPQGKPPQEMAISFPME